MGRAVVGVIAGYLGIGGSVAFTDALFARLTPGWESERPAVVLLRREPRNGLCLHDCGRILMRPDRRGKPPKGDAVADRAG